METGRRDVGCTTPGVVRLVCGGEDDVAGGVVVGVVVAWVVRVDVVLEVGGGKVESTLTGWGWPDSTASWSVVFLSWEWKSFKFSRGLLVVTA